MSPFNISTEKIADNIELVIIDIEDLSADILEVLDSNLVSICEGSSGTDLRTVKKYVSDLYVTKDDNWIKGATAEFFIHLYIKLIGFKQECLFLNLEEGSIKKGFDGYYSDNGVEWIMESKSGDISSVGGTHSEKVILAMSDLEKKVGGKDKSRGKKIPNNPWRNAYSHASLYDVGTSEKIRKNIKRLSDDFINGKFYDVSQFNTMPCGTIFLNGIWNPPTHQEITESIKNISNKLKGKQINVICVTQKTVDMFVKYIG